VAGRAGQDGPPAPSLTLPAQRRRSVYGRPRLTTGDVLSLRDEEQARRRQGQPGGAVAIRAHRVNADLDLANGG
jgi:hypothetical protein